MNWRRWLTHDRRVLNAEAHLEVAFGHGDRSHSGSYAGSESEVELELCFGCIMAVHIAVAAVLGSKANTDQGEGIVVQAAESAELTTTGQDDEYGH